MKIDRLSQVEKYIMQNGQVSLSAIADNFDFSITTARRDVIELEERGCIRRIRGGAEAKKKTSSAAEIASRQQKNAEAKKKIGEVASRLVADNQIIYVDAGSTAKEIVPFLGNRKNITIVTSSVNAILEAVRLVNLRIFCLGGEYSASADCFHGYSATREISNYNFDIAFLAATGISIDGGLTTATFSEAALKQLAISRAKKSVLMIDESKANVRSISRFATLDQMETIVCDKMLPRELEYYCREHHIEILTP